MNDAQSPIPQSVEPVAPSKQGKSLGLWRWFWRVALVVSIPLVWYCFYVPSNSIAWAQSYTAAQEQAVKSGKPMILFFTGNMCVPCRIMKRNVWADPEVTASVNAAFIPVTIDVADPGSADVRNHYSVGATPTTLITDPQGAVLQQRAGGMSKADFLKFLEKRNPSAVDGK